MGLSLGIGLGLVNGRAGAGVLSIQLSNANIPDTAASGSVVGTLSVVGGTGTFSLLNNPGSLFSITGTSLKTASALVAGSYPITIRFTGTPTVPDRPLLITVTHVGATSHPTFFILGF